MPYTVSRWPDGVYPEEMLDECPEAEATIDVLFARMMVEGASPDGYKVKNLGKRVGGLWQINLKVHGRQVRILYALYHTEMTIVVFRIHKKSSEQEQSRAYEVAKKRKRSYEQNLLQALTRDGHGRNRAIH